MVTNTHLACDTSTHACVATAGPTVADWLKPCSADALARSRPPVHAPSTGARRIRMRRGLVRGRARGGRGLHRQFVHARLHVGRPVSGWIDLHPLRQWHQRLRDAADGLVQTGRPGGNRLHLRVRAVMPSRTLRGGGTPVAVPGGAMIVVTELTVGWCDSHRGWAHRESPTAHSRVAWVAVAVAVALVVSGIGCATPDVRQQVRSEQLHQMERKLHQLEKEKRQEPANQSVAAARKTGEPASHDKPPRWRPVQAHVAGGPVFDSTNRRRSARRFRWRASGAGRTEAAMAR